MLENLKGLHKHKQYTLYFYTCHASRASEIRENRQVFLKQKNMLIGEKRKLRLHFLV